MKRILVINVNWLGDVIFSSPVFKALKETYPDAHISCMAVPRVKDVLESIPQIDEIILYDEKGRHWNPLAKLKFILELRRKHFDSAFLLHRSWTRALLIYCAGIPVRVGYDEKKRGWFLTHKVNYPDVPVHRSDYYLNIIESYGIPINDRQCRLNVSDEAKNDIEKILKLNNIDKNQYLIILNPGGNWDLKRWPLENFSRLIRGLVGSSEVKIVISGAQKDIILAKELNSMAFKNVIHLTGQTSLKQLMALMKRANLTISADSGPLHLANSVGCDVIGVYGPTRPEITGPRGSGRKYILQHDIGCNREPCYHLKCPDNVCMQSVTASDVIEIINEIRNP